MIDMYHRRWTDARRARVASRCKIYKNEARARLPAGVLYDDLVADLARFTDPRARGVVSGAEAKVARAADALARACAKDEAALKKAGLKLQANNSLDWCARADARARRGFVVASRAPQPSPSRSAGSSRARRRPRASEEPVRPSSRASSVRSFSSSSAARASRRREPVAKTARGRRRTRLPILTRPRVPRPDGPGASA